MIENTSLLIKLKGKYQGQQCFIMGNGPSLNKMNLELLRNEVIWGFNKCYLLFNQLSWRPKFYLTNDERLTRDIAIELDQIIPQMTDCLFFFPDRFLLDNTLKSYPNIYWYHEIPWDEEDSNSQADFSKDPTKHIVHTSTVTIAGLQLAAYLGFSPIYLIGCDTFYSVPDSIIIEDSAEDLLSTQSDDPNHFSSSYHSKGDRWSRPKVEEMIYQYECAKKALNDMGVEVYNATIGGYLEVFSRVRYEDLLQ